MSFLDRLIPRKKAMPDPLETYTGLRSLALTATPSQVGLAADDDQVFAVLLDLALGKGVATIVSMADGSTSMYTTGGGGMIGGGGRVEIAAASKAFVSAVDSDRHLLSRDWSDEPLPAGQARVIALTPSGSLAAVDCSDDLAAGDRPLSPVFAAGNNVITQIRLSSGK